MSKQELVDVLNKISDIEKLFKPVGGSFMSDVETIHRNKNFIVWKEELKRQLRKLNQSPLINEILQLLDEGFKNSLTDRRDFDYLLGKISALSAHLDEYTDEETEVKILSEKLKKGTIVKTAFDEYTLIEQVGEGGNGRVFSAKCKDGTNVAIKFVEKNISTEKLKRFKNEIFFCEHHNHPNVVKIIDRGYAFLNEKDYVFYVMPLYAETLADKINSGIPHQNVLDIFVGLLKGLKYAHEHRSIHRDIKPKNIMFESGSFNPIICDFGIAHFTEEDLLTIVKTKATSRMANFQYAAPEQRSENGKVCYQTDIYSLTLILNEMFTGEVPQAAGHTRIESVNPEYKYLDVLFDSLFKQNPEDRLYPEELILSELKLLAEQHHRDREAEKIKSVINEMIVPEEFNPSINNIEFKDGNLIFSLDSVYPKDWFMLLRNGSYSHSYILGRDTDTLREAGRNEFSMHIRGDESKETIKRLVEYVKSWVIAANKEYSQAAKRRAAEEHRRREAERLAEIQRIEKEKEMNSTINSLLKDLL